MWLYVACVTLAVGAVAADFSLDVQYSLDDWKSSQPYGSVQLRKSYDGNFTGVFSAAPVTKTFAAELSRNKESVLRLKTTNNGKAFETSAKPCSILSSRMVQQLWVSVDGERRALNGFTLYADPAFFSSSVCADSSEQMHTSVHVQTMATLPSPDTASFVHKMEREKKARQHGAEQDNRSFLAKYWMYIVPVVLFVVISNAVNPEAGEGGQ